MEPLLLIPQLQAVVAPDDRDAIDDCQRPFRGVDIRMFEGQRAAGDGVFPFERESGLLAGNNVAVEPVAELAVLKLKRFAGVSLDFPAHHVEAGRGGRAKLLLAEYQADRAGRRWPAPCGHAAVQAGRLSRQSRTRVATRPLPHVSMLYGRLPANSCPVPRARSATDDRSPIRQILPTEVSRAKGAKPLACRQICS